MTGQPQTSAHCQETGVGEGGPHPSAFAVEGEGEGACNTPTQDGRVPRGEQVAQGGGVARGKPEMALSPVCPLGWTTASLECQTHDSQLLLTGGRAQGTQDGSLRKSQLSFPAFPAERLPGCARGIIYFYSAYLQL